jgi:hypothetical protein
MLDLVRANARTPARRRAVTLLLGAVVLAAPVFWLVDRAFEWALGDRLGVLPSIALVTAPLIALYRYGVDGTTRRRALTQGTIFGLLVALLFWYTFIFPGLLDME